MIILGLDPGLATTGFGILEHVGSKFSLINYGVLSTSPKISFEKRLFTLYQDVCELFLRYPIEHVAIEELFFNTNTKTAMAVAQARGVLVLAAQQHHCFLASYTPPQIKLSICGYGKAEKKQVQYMVKQVLNMENIPKPDDAADALAAAICYAHSYRFS